MGIAYTHIGLRSHPSWCVYRWFDRFLNYFDGAIAMTKQIIIKHSSDDMDAIINDILKYLEVLIPAEARVICSFRLH